MDEMKYGPDETQRHFLMHPLTSKISDGLNMAFRTPRILPPTTTKSYEDVILKASRDMTSFLDHGATLARQEESCNLSKRHNHLLNAELG